MAVRIPKTLGGCADRLFDLRAERQELQKQIEKIKKQEGEIKERLREELSTADAEGVHGKRARVALYTERVGKVHDWEKFYTHIERTGAFELLQRRLANTAIRERWDDGKKVPGVEPFDVVKFSITKKR